MLQTSESEPDERGQKPPPDTPEVSRVKQGFAAVLRASLALLGALLIPFGVIVGFLTPFIPIGLPIVIVGVVLLARNAVWGRRFVQNTLTRHPTLERFAPEWLLRLIFGETTTEV